MHAIGALRALPVDDPSCLVDFETSQPSPGPRDLLVSIEAVGVNPVDTKVRRGLGEAPLPSPRVLGWDAAGTVVACGDEVTGFAPGDRVFYAGDVTRPGCNSELHLVDFRVAAKIPDSMDYGDAASWPLVSITAWELLFERMGVDPGGAHAGQTLLVINGAGGVGSVLIQLARQAGLTVVATASRRETIDWCQRMGANHVIDHHQPLAPQLEALGIGPLPFIANLYEPDGYWKQTGELIAPFGSLGLIVEPAGPLAIGDPYKLKCVRIAWEMMFSRTRFQSPDLFRQGEILAEISRRIEAGKMTAIVTRVLSPIGAESLREAHAGMEAGRAHGKWTLEGWA